MPIPKKYKCPITDEVMDDPVTLPCGHVFDFYNIINHCAHALDAGDPQPECPCCAKKLSTPLEYKKNDRLRNEIYKYFLQHPNEQQDNYSSVATNSASSTPRVRSRNLLFSPSIVPAPIAHKHTVVAFVTNMLVRLLPKT